MSRFTTILSRLFQLIYLLLPIASCVTVQEPEGGPPDETPPKLVRSFPENGTLNFKGEKIKLTFNKDIAVDNLYSNLLIMPKLTQLSNQPPYSYTISGKTLELKFNVPLEEETTYSIHFSKAIKDTHEGTKAANNVLIFSTGPFIDSISINGTIKELLTNKPVGYVNVYLYSATRNFKEFQEKDIPDYYTISDQAGNFMINYIRSGKYYIRATTGKSNAYKIDYEKDKYGFFKDPIDLSNSLENVVIPLISADVRDLQILRSTPQKGIFEIVFNKEVTNYQLIPLQTVGSKGKSQIYSSKQSPKTITIYNTFSFIKGDTFNIKLKAEDALHRTLEECISISFKEGKIDQTNLNYSLSPRIFPSILPDFRESILFDKPIKEIKKELIYFKCRNQQKIELKQDELTWNENRTKLTIRKHFTPEEIMQFTIEEQEKDHKIKIIKQIVTLQIEQDACTAFDQSTNKNISCSYPLRKKEETGTISGNVKTMTSHFIIELLNQKDECVDSIRDVKSYQFKMIPPGSYRIRILVLKESEDEWSPGNILHNIEPNPVIFYEKEINVTENWNITGINFKF